MTIHDTIAQIEAMDAKATPGPWFGDDIEGPCCIYSVGIEPGKSAGIAPPIAQIQPQKTRERRQSTADLIVALRNAAPSLIAYIRALEKVRDEAEQLCMIKPSVELEKALAAAREAGK